MCGLKEIFEGTGNFCDKKVPCKSHFSIREKLNLIRFIKTLYKIKIYRTKTLGLCPNTPPTFEKVGSKLLSKRNYIAFFGKK